MKQRFSLLVAVLLLFGTFAGAQAAGSSDFGTFNDPDPIVHPPLHVRTLSTNGSTPTGYSPAQLRHAYGFDQLAATGAGQVIGIVDAYDDPTIAADLAHFDGTFNLAAMNGLPGAPTCTVAAGPHPCFQKKYATTKPRTNGGWGQEISLDVEWSHAIAPGADILLVEASNAQTSTLLKAVDVAVSSGAHVVSMSWGGSESSNDLSFDTHFNKTGVAFFASSGDNGTGPSYPAASPYVVSVGGTTLPLDANGNLSGSETAWSGSGGGISTIDVEPGYQSSFAIPNTNGKRGIPDVSYNADPNTGVPVYDTTPNGTQKGWQQFGGTSAGSPQWAALTSLVDQTRGTPISTNSLVSSPLYNAAAGANYAVNYRDVVSGSNGTCAICNAGAGYDFVTGLGSPLASALIPYLATH